MHDLAERYPGLSADLVTRLARAYGTRTFELLGEASVPADLGQDFGGGLHRREVDYLVATEWAITSEDILFRRSKLGLHVPAGTAVAALDAYLAERAGTDRADVSVRSPYS